MLMQQVVFILVSIVTISMGQQACQWGWKLEQNKCYKVFNQDKYSAKNYSEALQFCREKTKRNGSLVEFRNGQALNDITRALQLNISYHYWIGLYRTTEEADWMWETGGKLSQGTEDIVVEGSGHLCGVILMNYNNNTKMKTKRCSSLHKYICQADSFKCSTGWNITSSKHCIKVESAANWTTALKKCRHISSALAKKEVYAELESNQLNSETDNVWWSRSPPDGAHAKIKCNESLSRGQCCAVKSSQATWRSCNETNKFICVQERQTRKDNSTDFCFNSTTEEPPGTNVGIGEGTPPGMKVPVSSESNSTDDISSTSSPAMSTTNSESTASSLPSFGSKMSETNRRTLSTEQSTSKNNNGVTTDSSSFLTSESVTYTASSSRKAYTYSPTAKPEDRVNVFTPSWSSTVSNVAQTNSSRMTSLSTDVDPTSDYFMQSSTSTSITESSFQACLGNQNNKQQRLCIKDRIPTGGDILCDGSIQQSDMFSKIPPADAYNLLMNMVDIGLSKGINGGTNSTCLGTSLTSIDLIAKSIIERIVLNTSNHLEVHTQTIDSRIDILPQNKLSTYMYTHKDSNISDLQINTRSKGLGDIKLSVTLMSTPTDGRVKFRTSTAEKIDGMYIFLVSRILSINAFGETGVYSLSLKYTLRHSMDSHRMSLQKPENKSDKRTICAFLDESTGSWSDDGCFVLDTDNEKTVCYCNHTTNFAILMQWTDLDISSEDEKALNIITYIGCGISLTTQIITLSIFFCVGSINSERVYIHRNLCFAISIAQIAFLGGIHAVEYEVLCSIVALVLHYFYLSVFVWMLVEGMHLYSKIVQVFGTEKSRIIYYSGFGWGLPLILVIISASADWDGYGTDKSCWLSIKIGTIWAFVGPAIGVIFVNLIILCMVVKILMNAAKIERNNEYDHIRAGIRGTIFLLPLLGLTWVFGLLAVNEDVIVFQYLFAIFNSLQGFFIFLFHCAFNKEVRQAFIRMRKRRSLRKGDFISLTSSVSSRPSERDNSNALVHNAQNIPPLWSVNISDMSVNSSTKSTDVKVEDDITVDDVTEC